MCAVSLASPSLHGLKGLMVRGDGRERAGCLGLWEGKWVAAPLLAVPYSHTGMSGPVGRVGCRCSARDGNGSGFAAAALFPGLGRSLRQVPSVFNYVRHVRRTCNCSVTGCSQRGGNGSGSFQGFSVIPKHLPRVGLQGGGPSHLAAHRVCLCSEGPTEVHAF